jgi:hypothetical protein
MPLALDPDETFSLVLKTDESKPVDSRPAFLFRFLTARKFREVQRLRQEASDEKNNEKCASLIRDALVAGLNGWKNMADIAYTPDAIDDVLTIVEKWELLNRYLAEQVDAEQSKNFSGSPSPTATEQSVKPVAVENAASSQA